MLRRRPRRFVAAGLGLFVAACSMIDQFSDRALSYNIEAELAQVSGILLNVIRASLRRPMEFTTVQTVQSSSGARGSAGLGLPFGRNPGSNTLNLSGEVSAELSQFATAVLDTQEFYNGILQPVAPSYINLLLKQGYSRSLIFYLVVKSIEFDDPNNGWQTTFENYVPDDEKFKYFRLAMDYFLRLGISMEEISTVTPIGPQLSKAEAEKQVVAVAKETKLSMVKKDKGYQVVRTGSDFRACFSPPDTFARNINPKALCGRKETSGDEGERAKLSVFIGPEFLQYLRAKFPFRQFERRSSGRPGEAKLAFNLRSPEDMIYFLGEITRRNFSEGGIVQILIGPSDELMPEFSCPTTLDGRSKPVPNAPNYHCESLFWVEAGVRRPYGTVTYENRHYSVHDEPGSGRSLTVLSLIKQLLALNAAAKEAPKPSALSVVVTP